jgi:hypothetical protein
MDANLAQALLAMAAGQAGGDQVLDGELTPGRPLCDAYPFPDALMRADLSPCASSLRPQEESRASPRPARLLPRQLSVLCSVETM